MTVKEAIALLQTFPQDALLIHTMCSDYEELEAEDFTFKGGPDEKGNGLIRHKGHLMDLDINWWPKSTWYGEMPTSPEYVQAVHIKGN